MIEQRLSVRKNIIRYQEQQWLEMEDEIVYELPLTIFLNGKEFATIICSPSHLEEMLIGFLASEGIINFLNQINSIIISETKEFVYIELVSNMMHEQKNAVKTVKPIQSNTRITIGDCFRIMNYLQESSTIFKETGGVHNASLCSLDGEIIFRSDIGRHNALDKLYGYAIQNELDLTDKLIAFSGRISSEIVLKVSKIGVGIILSKSAPTHLAIKLAEEHNLTTIGFIRGTRLNIYSHPERIIDMVH